MALVANDFRWHLSGATSAGGAQANPNASLGRFRSSTEIRAISSTLTSVAAAGALSVVDTAQIGAGSQVGRYLVFLAGNNGGVIGFFATRIVAFDAGTGTFRLHDPLPAAAAIGDRYHVYAPLSLFDAVSPSEAALAAGYVDHRMLIGFNTTGSSLTAVRYHLEPLDPGPLVLEIVADDLATGDLDYTLSASDIEAPGLTQFPAPQRFAMPLVRDGIAGTQPPLAYNALNNSANGVWIRRRVDPRTLGIERAVWKLLVTSTTVGIDPNPFASACLLFFSVTGITRQLSGVIDRAPRIRGGARLEATLRALETGLALESELVSFFFTGPGSISAAEALTDARGVARVAYTAPTSEAQAGQTLSVTAKA